MSHPLNRGRGRARRKLIADAVFTYTRVEARSIYIEQRFVEVDRTTLSIDRMVAELARYGQLERAREKGGEPLWRYSYPVFPAVICALTGASRKSLNRRLDVALSLLADHPSLSRAYGLRINFCLLDDLTDRGPFAPIFYAVGGDGAVDWLPKRPARRVKRLGLSEAEIEAVATRVADLLSGQRSSPELVDATAVARRFGVSRDFVYQHATELGAVRLGDGPKARLRFDLAKVGNALRRSPEKSTPTARRRATRRSSSLLPIRQR